MIKNSVILAAALVTGSIIGLSSCNTKPKTKADATKLSGAVKYVVHQENGKNALVKTGDFISLNIQVKNSKDSLLGSSYESGMPALQEVITKGNSGGFEDVLLKLWAATSVPH